MGFVFLIRYLLDMKSQKMWSKFTYDDYCVNKRSFQRYLLKDEVIIKRAKKYRKLPVAAPPAEKKTVVSKKKAGYSSFSEDSPMKRCCQLADSTTEEEDGDE